jgi:hypothetical protein
VTSKPEAATLPAPQKTKPPTPTSADADIYTRE